MAIYMKIDGITGNVTAKGHEKWIELHSMQFGVGRGIGSPTGKSSNRETSAPNVSEVVVTKLTDETSPLFFQESTIGKSKAVTLHIVRTSADHLETFYELILTNTLISGWSLSSGGDQPTESISMNFTKIQTKYIPFNTDHTPGTPVPSGYDMALGTKV